MPDQYTALIDQAEAVYQARMADPKSTTRQIIDTGYKLQLMKESYASMTVAIDPAQWDESMKRQLAVDLHFEETSKEAMDAYMKKTKQLQDIDAVLRKGDPNILRKAWPSNPTDPDWFPQRSPELRRALNVLATDLQDWATNQRVTPDFLAESKEATLKRYMTERPVPLALVRLTQTMKWDTKQSVRRVAGFVTDAQNIDKKMAAARRDGKLKWPKGMSEPEIYPLTIVKNNDAPFPPFQNSDTMINKLAGSGREVPQDTTKSDQLIFGDPPGYKVPEVPTPLLPQYDYKDESLISQLLSMYLKPAGTEQPAEIIASDLIFTTGLMFVPGASQVYSVMEILTGYNIFGYPLTDQDKLILAACLALPTAAKFAKLGVKSGIAVAKAAMTTKEASTLITGAEHAGQTVAEIEIPKIVNTANAAKQADAVFEVSAKAVRVGSAGETVLQDALKRVLLKEALSPEQEASVLKVITALERESPVILREITEEGLSVLAKIIAKYPVVGLLESNAWIRILKGVTKENVMGRLFEELWNVKVGSLAAKEMEQLLGSKIKGIVYVEGRNILSSTGQDITDGMFVVFEESTTPGVNGKVRIFASAELKSGATEAGAKKLQGTARSFEKTIELKGPSDLVALEERTIAAWESFILEHPEGEVSSNFTEFAEEFWKKEQIPKSQVEHVVERLTNTDGRVLKINGKLYDTTVDEGYKIFGVIPSDGGVLLKRYDHAKALLAGKGHTLVVWPLAYVTTDVLFEITEELVALIKILHGA